MATGKKAILSCLSPFKFCNSKKFQIQYEKTIFQVSVFTNTTVLYAKGEKNNGNYPFMCLIQ